MALMKQFLPYVFPVLFLSSVYNDFTVTKMGYEVTYCALLNLPTNNYLMPVERFSGTFCFKSVVKKNGKYFFRAFKIRNFIQFYVILFSIMLFLAVLI